MRRDDQRATAAHLHALHTGVPSFDHLAGAEAEVQGCAAIPRGVELLAGRPGDADVMHRHARPGGGLGAVAHLVVEDLQFGGFVASGYGYNGFIHPATVAGWTISALSEL